MHCTVVYLLLSSGSRWLRSVSRFSVSCSPGLEGSAIHLVGRVWVMRSCLGMNITALQRDDIRCDRAGVGSQSPTLSKITKYSLQRYITSGTDFSWKKGFRN